MGVFTIKIGIVETRLRSGPLTIDVIDVGGQRSQRKKWLHVLDNVDVVLFLVALSEYDQTVTEDPGTNRMHESICVFSAICNNPWFAKSTMLLFLNKTDVFEEKIKHSSLKKCFPEYGGGKDKSEAKQFISQMFLKKVTLNRPVYRHFTCAKDPQNIRMVFEVVIDLIMQAWVKGYTLV